MYKNFSIAGVDQEFSNSPLGKRFERMGYSSHYLFADVASLLVSLENGKRFDMVVASFDEKMWKTLATVCKVLGTPVLFVVENMQQCFLQMEYQNMLDSDVMDFAVSSSQDSELNWRIQLLLRRVKYSKPNIFTEEEEVWGNYRFISGQNIVFHKNDAIYLQARQFNLTLMLFRALGRVVLRDTLLATFWGSASPPRRSGPLDTAMCRIRVKLALQKENGFVLNSVYGQGYQLKAVYPNSSKTEARLPEISPQSLLNHPGANFDPLRH